MNLTELLAQRELRTPIFIVFVAMGAMTYVLAKLLAVASQHDLL